jgi:hypothetical protein
METFQVIIKTKEVDEQEDVPAAAGSKWLGLVSRMLAGQESMKVMADLRSVPSWLGFEEEHILKNKEQCSRKTIGNT